MQNNHRIVKVCENNTKHKITNDERDGNAEIPCCRNYPGTCTKTTSYSN
jgi:hypothetical protein